MKSGIQILFLALIILSCKSNKNAASDSQSADANNSTPDTVVVVVEKPAVNRDSLLIGFEKTPCFGRCPYYKVKVYRSGFATFEGLNFTEKLGLYSTRFSENEISQIFKSAAEIGYFSLEDKYDNPSVSDLPSTISTLNTEEEKKRIVARVNVPEKLKIFHENLAVTLQEKDWEPYSER